MYVHLVPVGGTGGIAADGAGAEADTLAGGAAGKQMKHSDRVDEVSSTPVCKTAHFQRQAFRSHPRHMWRVSGSGPLQTGQRASSLR